MNVIARKFLFTGLLGLAAFSSANAGYFPHAFESGTRVLRLERGERFEREHFAFRHFERGHFGREFRSEGRFYWHRDVGRLEVGRSVHELPLREFRQSGFALKR